MNNSNKKNILYIYYVYVNLIIMVIMYFKLFYSDTVIVILNNMLHFPVYKVNLKFVFQEMNTDCVSFTI